MRKSRLYLSLSIISMIAAVGVGVAQSHCKRNCHQRECIIAVQHELDAREAFETRDFAALSHQADALIADGEALDGRRWKAYALRGQGRLDDAIAAYHESMHSESGHAVQRPLLIDSYIGLADCLARKGQYARAKDWIERAHEEAIDQLERTPDEGAHYQLACVLAVRSTISKTKAAGIYRGLAIEQLKLAIRKGFDSWDHMRADIDLDALRAELEFQALFNHR